MRKITLILSLSIFSLLPLITSAQTVGNLWGMNSAAGDSGGGVLFCYNPLTQNDSISIPFSTPDGKQPYGDMVQGSDGSFYGMTTVGGAYFNGELFKWSPSVGMHIIHSFGGTTSDGRTPYGKVLIGKDGMLYGMTYGGGTNNDGIVFQCSTDGSIYNIIHTFSGNPNDGKQPYGSLVQGNNGMLYGMTYYGGLLSNGVIFKCSTNGSTFDTIHSFSVLSYDGYNPYGSPIIGKDGMLYGMTYSGGPNGQGTIFKCDTINGTAYDTVHTFGILNNDNGYPYGDLIQAKNGTLYGLTYSGGLNNRGLIFKCSTNGLVYDTLHSFNVVSGDGSNPYGRLIFGADSSLYGMTEGGGLYSNGSIFKCDTTGKVYDTLYSFNSTGTTGQYPYGSLLIAKDGNLYGMTEQGGSLNNGIIFSFNLTSGKENVVYSFGVNILGNSPYGKVIQGKDGNFYGMTSAGGQNGKGTIFKYTPSTGAMVVLHAFNGGTNDGVSPYGSLVMAHDGTFYGMTYKGGSYGYGTLFKCTPGGIFTLLHSFSYGSNDGGFPRNSLIFGKDGDLYGMSMYGGANGSVGALFKCDTLGNLTLLHSFSGSSEGDYPSGNLVQAND
ncbi:MAG TPA: choice-of-anchor tandem repeat GloVer-containing protein, partial [Bacteroidia bacterium]|nr:choice-of-anchor tandem repeat GloVer-containing protein [Bacteroidia bacterium]